MPSDSTPKNRANLVKKLMCARHGQSSDWLLGRPENRADRPKQSKSNRGGKFLRVIFDRRKHVVVNGGNHKHPNLIKGKQSDGCPGFIFVDCKGDLRDMVFGADGPNPKR